ncbi:hypothetical protein VCSRO136_3638 [Vibrio cholerae]|nr:hypothetical protein VCSRO136_3638 [Vibrio cholerae]
MYLKAPKGAFLLMQSSFLYNKKYRGYKGYLL